MQRRPSDYCWHIYENRIGICMISERRFRKKTDAEAFFTNLIKFNAEHIVSLETFNDAHDPYKELRLDDKREFVYLYAPGDMPDNSREMFIEYYQS